jgi:chorismate mutase/prephenate dehydratase
LTEDYLHILNDAFENLTLQEKDELLSKLRSDVDKIDVEITEILIRRISLSIEIGKIKRSLGLKTYDALREQEIDNNINKLSENPDIKKSLKRIYERIIDESRAVQKESEK